MLSTTTLFLKIEGIFLHRFLSLLAIKPACLNIKIFSKNPNRRAIASFKKICLVCLIVFFEKATKQAWMRYCITGDFLKPLKSKFMKTNDLFDGIVTRPYRTWSDRKLSSETRKMQTMLTGNPLVPVTQPTMEVFGAAVADYVSQLSKVGTRDVNAIAAKNVRRAELISLCVQLGNSVASVANGDVEVLVSTGLPLRKKRTAAVLSVPSHFRITNGVNPGELDLRVKGMKAARAYGFEYTIDPPTEDSVWIRTVCSTSRCTIKGLQAGKRYWFRPFVTGSKGQQITGDAILSPYVQ